MLSEVLLLVVTAYAALPWECPAFEAPPDAPQFRTDAGLGDTFDALRAIADAWIEPDCAWTETLLDSGATEVTCVTSAGAFVTITDADTAESGRDFPTDYHESHAWSLAIDLPPGADTWTALSLRRASSSSTMGGASGGGGITEASWIGAVLDLPDDAWFTLTSDSSCFYSECDRTYAIETPACAWSTARTARSASSGPKRAATAPRWPATSWSAARTPGRRTTTASSTGT